MTAIDSLQIDLTTVIIAIYINKCSISQMKSLLKVEDKTNRWMLYTCVVLENN